MHLTHVYTIIMFDVATTAIEPHSVQVNWPVLSPDS